MALASSRARRARGRAPRRAGRLPRQVYTALAEGLDHAEAGTAESLTASARAFGFTVLAAEWLDRS